ncbi:MAG: hypothetical protein H7X99_01615 [Saprospiraceae bacterium]|nr:hypothetical protein [Saprospiraceae bacterium]
MAKLSSLFKFEGTVDDYTVVKNSKGTFLRRKGGLSKERIATDPKLKRIRENNMEFGTLAAASKLIRTTFSKLKQSIRVQYLTSRLTSIITGIKNQDVTSARGLRKVAIGIVSDEGKKLLKGFNFNESKVLSSVLQNTYTLDSATGAITIPGLIPGLDILGGVGANRVGLQSYWAKIDFENGESVMSESNLVKLALDGTATDVTLSHAAPPAGDGVDVFVLSVIFYQTMNGNDYVLLNGAHNVADIIEVV